MTLTFGSLFAGIGGFDLGFERAGLECRWQVEIDEYCQRVLAKHWPDVGRWDDVRTFPPSPAEDWRVDVICGGFPCQPFSCAGAMQGSSDERNLWPDTIRIIRILRPRYVVLENVSALLANPYFGTILGELATSGFDAEWDCFPASSFGAHHIRDRLFILGERSQRSSAGPSERNLLANPCGGARIVQFALRGQDQAGHSLGTKVVAGRNDRESTNERHTPYTRFAPLRDEPKLDRLVYGIPNRMDRVGCAGNAVVPQIAEWIGRRILESYEGRS